MSECALLLNLPEFKMGHVGSKTRSLGQFLEKPCVLSRRHSFDPVFMELCQNDFLTLNKRLSRRAMLSDDSSCFCMLSHKNFLSIFQDQFIVGQNVQAKWGRNEKTYPAKIVAVTERSRFLRLIYEFQLIYP